MTDQIIHTEIHTRSRSRQTLLLALAALLVSFGLTMFLFSAAYARDVQLLAKAPEMVWAFICGRPSEYGITLPLLLTIGTMSLLGSGAALLLRGWRGRSA